MLETVKALLPWLSPYRRTLIIGFACLIIKDALAAVLPLFLREGVNAINASFAVSRLIWFAVALLGFTALKGGFMYLMRVLLIGVSRDVEFDMRRHLYHRLVALDGGFFSRQRTGDIMARATNDLNQVRMMLGPGVMYLAETSLTFVLSVAVMLWVDWQLTLIALLPAPLVSIAVMRFGRFIHTGSDRLQALVSDISSRVQESVSGVRVLRAYTQEKYEQEEFERINRHYIAQNLKLGIAQGAFMPVLELLIGLSMLVVLWAGGARLAKGQIGVGDFLMFNFYMGLLGWPMIAMGWVVNLFQRGSSSWKRLRELMQQEPSIKAPAAPVTVPEPLAGEIVFDGVSVEFDGVKVLDAVSLRIPAGSTVAMVGPTGCGKTTLLQLVPRLIDPSAGRVLVDGIDVREFDPAQLRHRIGFVQQETFLFSALLKDNIALGVPGAPEDEVRRAAALAGLSTDLEGFPKGLETQIGERGITLSGGQKQRVSIARAILRDPRILVLDDAFASVDTVTEERVLNNLREVMHGRTTLLVSHRVSTARRADWIVVIDGGRVVAQGTHEQLVAQGGYYADLDEKQALEQELEALS